MKCLSLILITLSACHAPDGGLVDASMDPDANLDPPGDAQAALPAPAMTPETFAIHVNHLEKPMPNDLIVPGPVASRIWDTSFPQHSLEWPAINTCPSGDCAADPSTSKFDFTYLDMYLQRLHAYGYSDVLYTISREPPWASQRGARCTGPGTPYATCTGAADTDCDYATGGGAGHGYGAGECETNIDLHADGKGSNATWRNWVFHLVTHLRAQGYGDDHARVAYYEIWNEAYRSDTLWKPNNSNCVTNGQSCSYRGTWAQMLRMMQDARCIIIGNANDPITALGKTCGTDATLPGIGLDPTAKIVSPSAGSSTKQNRDYLENLFYCSVTDVDQPTADCTWSSANPLGANAVDVINTHGYYHKFSLPEKSVGAVVALRGLLATTELAKPMFLDEGNGDFAAWPYDPELEAASVPRYYLGMFDQGVSRIYWDNAGAPLWLANGDGTCTQSGGCATAPGKALGTTIAWLVDKAVYPKCQVTGTVHVCNLVSADPHYRGLVVWDVGACKASSCDSATSFEGCTYATDCTTTPFTLPTGTTWTAWYDLDTNTAHTSAVLVGVQPILIEGHI